MRPYQFAPDHFEQQGWEGQLRRVERWHKRAVHVLDPYSGVAGEEAIDFLYAFFQSAYHMRDWLQHSGAASKASLDAPMSANRCLKLCRDVCNGSKHFVLDPGPFGSVESGRLSGLDCDCWPGGEVNKLAYLVDAGVPSWPALRLNSLGFERTDAARLSVAYENTPGHATADIVMWLVAQPIEDTVQVIRGSDRRALDYDFDRLLRDVGKAAADPDSAG